MALFPILMIGATLLMCGLKLANVGKPAQWSWFTCMSPILVPLIFSLLLGAFYFFIGTYGRW